MGTASAVMRGLNSQVANAWEKRAKADTPAINRATQICRDRGGGMYQLYGHRDAARLKPRR